MPTDTQNTEGVASRKPIDDVREQAKLCKQKIITRHHFRQGLVDRLFKELHEHGWDDDNMLEYIEVPIAKYSRRTSSLWVQLPRYAIAQSNRWQEALAMAGMKPGGMASPMKVTILWDHLIPYFKAQGNKIKEALRQKALDMKKQSYSAETAKIGTHVVGPANLNEVLGIGLPLTGYAFSSHSES